MSSEVLYKDILSEIENMPVIDTHEHLESEEIRIKRKVDMFNTYLLHYASSDLISAGMPQEDMEFLKSGSDDLDAKWQLFRPYWEKARNTTYCKALIYATNRIYGIDDINDGTYRVIDEEIKKRNRKGLYKSILKDICKIEVSILDGLSGHMDCDPEFFVPAIRFDDYIRLNSKEAVTKAEERYNVSIHCLKDWAGLLVENIEGLLKKGKITCIKSGLAYERTLRFDKTGYSEADGIFSRILSLEGPGDTADLNLKPLEDYMMHVLVQTAADLDIPIQFHTGLQEGNGNIIYNSNPVNLINLFLDYPKARFDIFHGGYPYGGELCAMAKNFPNVYVDLCWTHIISREYTIRLIEELLDTVPTNKVFGFGGDYLFVEGVCGHLIIARENIARALANKVERGYLSRKEGTGIARKLLCDNAKEFFRL